MEKILRNVLGKLHISLTDKTTESIVQFIKFGLVGVTNTLLSYAIYLLVLFFMRKLGVSWDIYVGSILAFVLSVLWSFFLNNRLVFKAEKGSRSLWTSLLKTYVSYGFTGIILANILLYVWVSVLGVPKTIAPAINLLITVPLNFILNKFWAFRTGRKEENEKNVEAEPTGGEKKGDCV